MDSLNTSSSSITIPFYNNSPLKKDHELRPCWIDPNQFIVILENHSPLAPPAKEFLTTIAEPVTRPKYISEYKITTHSLYGALCIGLEANHIINTLNKLSKTELDQRLIDFIKKSASSYAKVKLILKANHYLIESKNKIILETLLSDKIISDAYIQSILENSDTSTITTTTTNLNLLSNPAPNNKGLKIAGIIQPELKEKPTSKPEEAEDALAKDLTYLLDQDEEDEEDISEETVYAFEITPSSVEKVRKRCHELEYPLLEEYDFRADILNPDLAIDLKPNVQLRPYQQASLSTMFSNGRSRSGIIVLPCGAGKTLVGIAAACTIGKRCLVLCTSAVSVSQWRREFLRWSTLPPDCVTTFTSSNKEFYANNVGVVVTTYSMLANLRHRSHASRKMISFLEAQAWGLLLLDEVHVVPANLFRSVVTKLHAQAKLGLTATLVREDDRITDLNFLIGPKLYEASWMELAEQGHIANVACAAVWCPMTREFYREYLRETPRKKALLAVMNPTKFQACQYLIELHEARGDKIIVFSDNVYALQAYALKLKKPFIYGATAQLERLRILQQFRYNPQLNTIFLSKVGDTSIDLPEASVLIQISAHYGSRRQEAQRLGRILRAKKVSKTSKTSNPSKTTEFNAHFYTLVSRDTAEMYFAGKRQSFLVDQGYAFKTITSLDGMNTMEDCVYPTRESQLELLHTVLMAAEEDGTSEEEESDSEIGVEAEAELNLDWGMNPELPTVRRIAGSITSLSGADTMAYVEYNRPVAHQFRNQHNSQGVDRGRGRSNRNNSNLNYQSQSRSNN